ncbi:MAG: hypothetical protein ABI599_15175, partial [Flavobacteriales bacterium]
MSTIHLKRNAEALNDRFIAAMEELGYTGYSLSKALGTSEAVISNIRNRKNPPNILLVRDLLDKHLALDPDWLLFGRGQMLRDKGEADPAERKGVKRGDLLARVDRRLESLEQLIKKSLHTQLERTVIEDETISDLAERVQALEKEVVGIKKPG